MPRLENGQPFPTLTLARVGGGTIDLPGDLAGSFGVVLVNRGAWCPYCTTQLTAFARAKDALDAAGITVVSLSVDDEATSHELSGARHLNFPLAHSADLAEVSTALGTYVNQDPPYLQASGFILAPDGRVLLSVYSSGAIGRLVPDDVVGMVTYLKTHS